MDQPSSRGPDRILIIGRSPSVILDAAEILRTKGFQADATNQFDEVLTAYDTTEVDVVLFGGMVPADTKRHLRDEISKVNDHVTFVQGLAGIPGLIAAQIEGAVSPAGDGVTYDPTNRTLHLTLKEPTEVIINAFWGTSFTPPNQRAHRGNCSIRPWMPASTRSHSPPSSRQSRPSPACPSDHLSTPSPSAQCPKQ
jgi:hypothetical protein